MFKSTKFTYKNNNNINLDYFWLSANTRAKNLLKENYDNLNYSEISGNSGAIEIIKNMSPDRIDYSELSRNENALELLKNNKDMIDWDVLSGNSQAIELLADNPDKIYPNRSSKVGFYSKTDQQWDSSQFLWLLGGEPRIFRSADSG